MKTRAHGFRLLVLVLFFFLVFLALLWRILHLMVLDRPFLQGQGNARSLRVVDIPAYRGMILDRQGSVLSVSTPVQSLWINPKAFDPSEQERKALSRLLSISPGQLSQIIAKSSKREFIYLQRQLNPILAQKITKLKIPGLNFQEEFKRYYPEGESAAQLLGFTNVDDDGIEGLELAYQDWLKGIPGKRRVVKDRLGQIIEVLDLIKEPRPGNSLQLSMDRRIQYLAYHELQNTLDKYRAKSGTVVVLDTRTGEVLAIANAPSFNPNVRSQYALDTYRNKALTDAFEPGSVIKPFSIAAALESGKFTPRTIIDNHSISMMVSGHLIRDVHNYGVLDVTGVLSKSSNVGVTKMTLANPPEQLIGLLLRCGFSQRTESYYPGESEGSLVHVKDANPFVLATISFGYGISVTALQLAKAYLIFANQGLLLPISLLHLHKSPSSIPVISAQTASQVLAMMEDVVSEGTGRSAKVSGYRVAGKTGTAWIAGKKGYQDKKYLSSFVGIAPASNPRLIVAVLIQEPTRELAYYGAAVAAPLFAKVMGSALRILDIPPDN